MVLMAGYDLPVRAIRQQVSSALDMIVHIERMEDGSRRGHRDHRGSAHGVRRDHAAGHLRVQDRLVRSGRHDQRRSSGRPGSARSSSTSSRSAASSCRRACSRTAPSRRTSRISAGDAASCVSLTLAVLACRSGDRGAAGRRRRPHGIQVVEAGTALFPDRAYVLTLTEPRSPRSRRTTSTVTENGKPVKDLSVLYLGVGEGIGTVLLIDASNSMKGSIKAAMAGSPRVRRAQPGPAALGRVLQLEADRRAAPDDRPARRSTAVLAKPPKLAEGTRLYDALAAAVAQVRGSALGAARVVLAHRRRRRRQHHDPGRGARAAPDARRSASTRSGSSRPTSRRTTSRSIAETPAAPTPPRARPRR